MSENLFPKPSVGRIVHFRDELVGCFAAVITGVISDDDNDDNVNLFIMGSHSVWHEPDVTLGTVHGTWHWPERV